VACGRYSTELPPVPRNQSSVGAAGSWPRRLSPRASGFWYRLFGNIMDCRCDMPQTTRIGEEAKHEWPVTFSE
jgi:hypothetical protein